MNAPTNTIAPKDEPAITGKVILYTTNGELEIELWAREMPLACRNFIQLCLEGYYDNTIFHRVIPGFMIQAGDPTGTGTGGQSIYGAPFKDQFHQRLKFGRRGMVAMANSGKDTNNSQFFITFGECPHLNKKHTIFGKVVGDSIYNLMSLQSIDTDDNDRPNDPPYIRKTRVVLNPFDDIIPRTKDEQKQPVVSQADNEQKALKKKNEIKKLKNRKKLTFDEGDVEETNDKIKSSHDTLLHDQRLSKQSALTREDLELRKRQKEEQERKKKQIANKITEAANNQEEAPQRIAQSLQAAMLKKQKAAELAGQKVEDQILQYRKVLNPQTGKMEIVWGEEEAEAVEQEVDEGEKMRHLRQLQDRQYAAMRADELNFKQMREGSTKAVRRQLVAQEKTLLSNVQKRKYQFLRKNQIEKKETEIFSKLNKFTERLQSNKPNDWMCHRLKFHIDSENAYNLDRKNQERKGRAEDIDDGGLKVEYGNDEEEMNLDELYELAKGDEKGVGREERQGLDGE